LYGALNATLASRTDIRRELIFVDDGSQDGTRATLEQWARHDPHLTIVALTRNFGHQPAVSAGLRQASGDAVIVCDADLQDAPEVMLSMIERWQQGADVVYGVRSRRSAPAMLRAAYFVFYRLLQSLSDIRIPIDSGDFGLMDRRVVDAINALPERNRFVRGLRAWVGYEQVALPYCRAARSTGKSSYSLSRLVRLALDGICDFSTKPLTAIFLMGMTTSLLSLAGMIFFLLHRILDFKLFGYSPADVPGFTSLVLAILFLGGVQLLAIGVIGEYVGRIYEEVKHRPNFLVKSVIRGREQGGAPASEVK
jgi:dolichol-phosphate mannosyltransferase